ncbi:ferredoxin [Caldimicrobium thiodismutans]|uniref:Ferredoxin n=1 Tax=Caldimicrobium thiodismutans TaxID=1653476 RepID=A0A0U5AFE6_9BACT|nr:ASKHA domain-containing protein [Caldimicrobium thiodismutans]BAU22732.1 ferredoxin [Caldimicrobium thiodismutans]
MPRVLFQPYQIEAEISPDETVIDLAMKLGIHINASCGGIGVCNKCKVFLESGEAKGEKIEDIYYKACTLYPVTDIVVRIPVESHFDRKALLRKTRAQALERKETLSLDPPIKKVYLELTPPDIEENTPDLERLLSALSEKEFEITEVPYSLLRSLPHVLREADFKVTVTLFKHARGYRLIDLEAGYTLERNLAVAMDLGTTTLQLELLDLNSGETLAYTSDYNPQISYGEDVISRIEFARKKDGLKLLAERVKERSLLLMEELLKEAGRKISEINLFSIAGNTVMTHLFLELEPRFLREYPYVPVAKNYPLLRAKDLGLPLKEESVVLFSPSVASYVGGDITAGVLASLMAQEEQLTLFIDLGTNGEIVVGNRDFLMCAACSAGPAFEGGGIKCGMRATSGAIESVNIDPQTYEPMFLTIGRKKAKGICGSGIISLMASLLRVGLIDKAGKYRRDLKHPRLREGDEGYEYILVFKEDSATGADIVFTENDIENLIRAKGAMFAGYQILLESVGLSINELERVFLAGTFGSYIDLEDAITIGLLPDLPRDRFYFLGNTSLQGAKKVVLYTHKREELMRITQMMTHVELSNHPKYMDYYMAALFLPHTDESLFPSLSQRG